MAKNRQIDNNDLLNYLQENNALLKTILKFLEQQTDEPVNAQKQNIEKFTEIIQYEQFLFKEKLKYKQKENANYPQYY